MSEISITIPREYGYVVLATTGTFFLGMWQGLRIGSFRKKAVMKFPKMVADSHDLANADNDAHRHAMYLFNCAMRAHHNYLENAPFFIAASLLAGLQFPLTVAVCSALWSLSRVIYAIGYTRADKKEGRGRVHGLGWYPPQFIVFILAGMTGYSMLA